MFEIDEPYSSILSYLEIYTYIHTFGLVWCGSKLCLGRTGSSLQMNRLSLRNKQLKLETSREVPLI